MSSLQKLTNEGTLDVKSVSTMIKLATIKLGKCGINFVGLKIVKQKITEELQKCHDRAFFVKNLSQFKIFAEKRSIFLKPNIVFKAESPFSKIANLDLKPNDLSSLEKVKVIISKS